MASIAWSLIFVGGCILHAGGIQSGASDEAAIAGLITCLVSGIACLLSLAMPFLKRHGSKPLSELCSDLARR